ncbi:capsid protein [Northern red-backed vole stool-associated circular virus 11]|uniref:Capsid protein n=1 Tax=Northern red-backed vole stool-associated circular virus 11 TaxID=2714164 RepID=A0AAE7C148_9VIRU|nr:capsid protein [Northern red-backed vole stool-associated circular virus 11]QIK03927.1 capsid protein [Northern red-backed vole stool-associated circular virus 11]
MYPAQLPGFTEYGNVYSHFKMLKCVLHISSQYSKAGDSFLVVPSRNFATTVGPFGLTNGGGGGAAEGSGAVTGPTVSQLLPPAVESALRQSKWQKTLRPNTTKTYVRVGFKPYTMVATLGPVADNTVGAPEYYRTWEASRWMPMSWAVPQGSSQAEPAHFYGPYIAENQMSTNEAPQTPVFYYTMTVYFQFRGQK